jgi:hypothetical protein
MQALDSFISPIPGFDGDILIPAVPVLAGLLEMSPRVTPLQVPVPAPQRLGLVPTESNCQSDSSKERPKDHGEICSRDQNQ